MKLLTKRHAGQTTEILDAIVRFNANRESVGIERFEGQMPIYDMVTDVQGRQTPVIRRFPLQERHFIEAARFPGLFEIVLEEGEEMPSAPKAQPVEPREYSNDETHPGLAESGALDIAPQILVDDALPDGTAVIAGANGTQAFIDNIGEAQPVEVPDMKAVVDPPLADDAPTDEEEPDAEESELAADALELDEAARKDADAEAVTSEEDAAPEEIAASAEIETPDSTQVAGEPGAQSRRKKRLR